MISQRLKSSEDKDTETVSSRTSSGKDSSYAGRQPVGNDKPQPTCSAAFSVPSTRLERRSATIKRTVVEQQSKYEI